MPKLPSSRAVLPFAGVLLVLALAAVAVAASRRPAAVSVTTTKQSRTVRPGGVARYALRIDRPRRLGGRVHLSVRGGPPGATVTWRRQARRIAPALRHWHFRTRMLLQTAPSTVPGTYALTITARNGRRTGTHHVRLVVLPPSSPSTRLAIAGSLSTPLSPGRRVPLDIVLTNPESRPVLLSALRVTVDPRTSSTACSGTENFRTTGMRTPPLPLPPGETRLSALLASADWPQVEMLDLPVSQDACKHTRLVLHYEAEAR